MACKPTNLQMALQIAVKFILHVLECTDVVDIVFNNKIKCHNAHLYGIVFEGTGVKSESVFFFVLFELFFHAYVFIICSFPYIYCLSFWCHTNPLEPICILFEISHESNCYWTEIQICFFYHCKCIVADSLQL